MVHLSLVALLAIAFSGVASAAPGLGDIHARGSHSFYTCTAGTNKIISVNISPDPPVPGEHFSVTVKASAPEQILKGSDAELTVSRGSEQLWDETVQICDLTSCPIQRGTYSIMYSVFMPKGVSPNEVSVRIEESFLLRGDLSCVAFTPN